MKQATFLLAVLITFACFANKKKARSSLLFLLSFYLVFNLGWIFYHFTGVMAVDFPIIALIIFGKMSRGKFRFMYPNLTMPAILIIIWSLITGFFSLKFGWVLGELSMIVRGYLAFVAVANNLKTKKDVDSLLNGFFVAAALEFLMAMWQWRYGPTPLRPFINEQFHEWRATGSFYMPHYLANFMMMLMPVLFRLFLYYKSPDKKQTIRYGVLLAVSMISFLVTFARGPWIAFAASVSVASVLTLAKSKYRPKVKWALGLLIVGGCALVIQYSSTIVRQFGKERSDAATIRVDQARIAQRLIKDNILFGTGLGNYELISPNYVYDYEKADPRSWQFSEMVHNSYLFFTAQLGLPGILFLLWGATLVFKKGFKTVQLSNPYFSNIGIGVVTGCGAVGIAFLAGPDIKSYQLLVHLGIYVGLIVALVDVEKMMKRRMYLLKKQKYEEDMKRMALKQNGI